MTTLIRISTCVVFLAFYGQAAFAVTPGLNWKDSYSFDGQCYCDTTYDHQTGGIIVSTPAGNRTVRQICEKIGPGPGAANNPLYNDVQCGNGPPNNAIDEVLCPGRVDMGKDGCDVIGPTWNLSVFFPANTDSTSNIQTPPQPEPEAEPEATPATTTNTPAEQQQPSQSIPPESVAPDANIELQTSTPAPSGGTTIQPVGSAFATTNFSSKDNRWVLTDARTPSTSSVQDPDGPHTNSALDGRYLELLPDVKVTDADTASADSVWPTAGHGPQVQFDINIAQAGTYAVYVHAFSTGEFDDTIHVGFDGTWPYSGRSLHTCGTRGQWVWTQCENESAATITIPVSGTHSIQFAAHDDGFEFDEFVLQLLNDDGSPAVQPEIQTASQNKVESPTENNGVEQTDETGEPELGQAVQVGVGSLALASAPANYLVLLLSALCVFLRRIDASAIRA